MGNLTEILPKLRLLIPRLASDADGEVVATVAAIRRLLERHGLDLHDLAAALGPQSAPQDAAPQPLDLPSDMALLCLLSGVAWKPHEDKFLNQMLRFGDWSRLSIKQENWLRGLLARTLREEAA